MEKETTRFSVCTDEELVKLFNDDVNKPGWVQARAIFLHQLREEFVRRNIDISAVLNESGGFNLNRKVTLLKNRLVVI